MFELPFELPLIFVTPKMERSEVEDLYSILRMLSNRSAYTDEDLSEGEVTEIMQAVTRFGKTLGEYIREDVLQQGM